MAIALLLAAVSVAGNAVSGNKVSRDPYTNASSYHATEVEADTFSFRKRVVAAFQAGRFAGGGASNIGWALSPNGGLSWRHGFLRKPFTLRGYSASRGYDLIIGIGTVNAARFVPELAKATARSAQLP